MSKQKSILVFSPLFMMVALFFVLIQTGCTTTQTGSTLQPPMHQPQPAQIVKQSPLNYGSIAMLDINIKHPTARLVFKKKNVQDRITRSLQESKAFKVIDWDRLEDVLFRRNLESSDLISNLKLRKEIGEVLLNDYFLQGSVTSFGERMDYESNAFSKQKTQVVDVEIEMFVKNALTNEIIASANGQGQTRKVISQTLGFGAAGGNDTVAANQALGLAIDQAVNNLLGAMKNIPEPVQMASNSTNISPNGKILKQPDVKVLFVLSETEERNNTRLSSNDKAEDFTSSTVEHGMAKVFADAEYQVLTADDVLGKAHSVYGDENIILSGWVNEKDIEEFENLLQARSGLAVYAVKVGEMANADIVITGSVKYELGEISGPRNINAKTNSVILLAKALLVKEKKTYDIVTVEKTFMAILNSNTMKARETALLKAAVEAGEAILRHTPRIQK